MPSAVYDLKASLQTKGDFLSLTRQHEWSMPAFEFVVQDANRADVKVSVKNTGIICFEPMSTETTHDIVLSSAVHGNETAPIEICDELIQAMIQGKLAINTRVLFQFGNPAAINIGERFVEENLNRLFSGAHSEGEGKVNKERVRAEQLEQSVREFFLAGEAISSERRRTHYDLHTAIRGSKNDKFAVYPFRHGKPWKKEQILIMGSCGVSTILLSHNPTTTYSYFSSNEFGADAFTVELGKVRPFGENNSADFAATKLTLAKLIEAKNLELPAYHADDFQIFEIDQTINKATEDFTLNFADDTVNFTDYPLGYVLATDGDVEHKVRTEGEAIVFPNANVALGQRALLTVKPTSID